MSDVLVGRSTGGVTGDFTGNGNSAIVDFVAASSGKVEVLGFHPKLANAGLTSLLLALYADSGGVAAARLGLVTITQGIQSGAPVFGVIPAAAVVLGTTYWLGWEGNGEQFDWQGENTGQYLEVAGGSLGDPWGGGGAVTTNHEPIIWAATLDHPLGRSRFMGNRHRPAG